MLRDVNCKCACHNPGVYTTSSTELAQSIVLLANAVKDLCDLIVRLESKI